MTPEARKLTNIIILGCAFMFVFTAFQTCGNIEQTVIKSINSTHFHGSGYTSLAIIYTVFSASNLLTPSIVALLGPQLSMFISGLVYSAYVAVFIEPYTWSFYLASVIIGIAAAESAINIFLTKEILLLSVCIAYTGLELTFFSGVYGTCLGATNYFGDEAKSMIGLSGIFVGVGEIIGGATFGLLNKFLSKYLGIGRNPVVLLGLLCHILAYYLIFLNVPNDAPIAPDAGTNAAAFLNPSKFIAIVCSFLLGLGDSCFNTQLLSIVGFMYAQDSAPAFAIFKFVQSISAAIAFGYSNYLMLQWQLLILCLTAFFGTISFILVEWEAKSSFASRGYDRI